MACISIRNFQAFQGLKYWTGLDWTGQIKCMKRTRNLEKIYLSTKSCVEKLVPLKNPDLKLTKISNNHYCH